jgi:hypothetical protein
MTANTALDQVKALKAERRAHEQAISLIDQQLREIRHLLGNDLAPHFSRGRDGATRPARVPRPWTGAGSRSEDRVLAALGEREPQTTSELKRLGTTIPALLPKMVRRGVLVRRRVEASNGSAYGKPGYLYARSAAALPPDEEDASADTGAG